MDQLFELFLNMVKDNTNIKDYETQYIFAASLLSIFLLKGNMVISKMPELLCSTDIYSDNRKTIESEFRLFLLLYLVEFKLLFPFCWSSSLIL